MKIKNKIEINFIEPDIRIAAFFGGTILPHKHIIIYPKIFLNQFILISKMTLKLVKKGRNPQKGGTHTHTHTHTCTYKKTDIYTHTRS